MVSVPRRIHILGGEATGKTTLSRRLGSTLDAPVHNLDAVAWIVGESDLEVLDPRFQPSAPVAPRPPEGRRQLVAEIAAGDAWVTEGKYVGWTAPLLERADVIVFLDHVPTWRATIHILARAARSAIREARRRRGRDRFLRFRDYAVHGRELAMQLYRRIGYGGRNRPAADALPADEGEAGDDPSRAAALASLQPFAAKLVHVRRRSQLEEFMADVEARVAAGRTAGPDGRP